MKCNPLNEKRRCSRGTGTRVIAAVIPKYLRPVKCAIYGLSSKRNWTSMSPLCENRRCEAFQTPYVLLSTREKVVCGVQKGGFTEATVIC